MGTMHIYRLDCVSLELVKTFDLGDPHFQSQVELPSVNKFNSIKAVGNNMLLLVLHQKILHLSWEAEKEGVAELKRLVTEPEPPKFSTSRYSDVLATSNGRTLIALRNISRRIDILQCDYITEPIVTTLPSVCGDETLHVLELVSLLRDDLVLIKGKAVKKSQKEVGLSAHYYIVDLRKVLKKEAETAEVKVEEEEKKGEEKKEED